MKKSRIAASLLAVALCLSCGTQGYGQEQTVLHVVTEVTYREGVNRILQDAMDAFSQSHTDVSFELEILPFWETEREARLETLRLETEQGNGPDLYFLPTRNVLEMPDGRLVKVEPLFESVPKAMKEGAFYDISPFFREDDALNSSDFQQVVLNAGCIGQSRYVLLLSFAVNAFYFVSDGASEYRPDMTVLEVMDAVLASGNAALAAQLCGNSAYSYWPESVFSELFDSETGNVTLSFEEAAEFFSRYQKLQSLADQTQETWNAPFSSDDWGRAVLHEGYVSGLCYSALAERDGKTLTPIPVRASNGQVTAAVCWYGAVGAECKNPALACEFLKDMLLPEYQWRVDKSGEQCLPGWPVRVTGSVDAVWPQFYQKIKGWPNWSKAERIDGTDERITQVTDEITNCGFRVNASLVRALERLKTESSE